MTSSSFPTLMILAAGMSSRYGEMKQTDLVGPGDHALIEYTLYDALATGWKDFLFIVRDEIAASLKQFFTPRLPRDVRLRFSLQRMDDIPAGFLPPLNRKKPWGTAHAMLSARNMIATPFATVNCDDYYGPQVLADMYQQLQKIETPSNSYLLAGYQLEDTLSPHGTVSRAICITEENKLQYIEEHPHLSRRGSKIVSLDSNQRIIKQFTGDETVSMNLFGFTPRVFSDTWELFTEFLTTTNDTKEFYLPSMLNTLIATKKASVTIVPASEKWYGLTHPSDRETVRAELTKKIKEKIYPLHLWK